jgi:hypothetical protein
MGRRFAELIALTAALACQQAARATPANKKALADYFGPLAPARGFDCRACHVAATPTDDDHEHNPFGARLVAVRAELRKSGKPTDLRARLEAIVEEDSDGDGIANLVELLTGHNPGDPADKPTPAELANAAGLREKHRKHLAAYAWRPFDPVRPPVVPVVHSRGTNPIDAFLDAARAEQGLSARPPASKTIQLRRVYLDLVGLPPTPAEQDAFEDDDSPDAYERVVDRLLASSQYGERWGRHWMDVWRYSDWAGYGAEVRESQPHVWRWRDWIIESLNADKGYDRMVREMLAGDEIAPDDPTTLRATGFLVRQYYVFNRNVVLDNAVEHTAKAFLGVTLNCARCHDHKYDPISQRDYYSFKAFFEPVQFRTDRVPGQPDTKKAGLVHAYDAAKVQPTHLLIRGDEKEPDPQQVCAPAVPPSLGGCSIEVSEVALPRQAYQPDRRPFVIEESLAAARQRLQSANAALKAAEAGPAAERSVYVAKLASLTAGAELIALRAALQAERCQDDGTATRPRGRHCAELAVTAQRLHAEIKARTDLARAETALEKADPKAKPKAEAVVKAARSELTKAETAVAAPLNTKFAPTSSVSYPATSTGRRLALARWITDRSNPLAARVAVNHIWARHFGQPLVPTVFDFGRNGQAPTHPALLDWLAAEFMDHGWSMKHIHRLIVTSAAYRRDTRPDPVCAERDPDNRYLWRMNGRRMEAEVVRDSVLAIAGRLDLTAGGPDLDYDQGLTTFRRSVFYRSAKEKQMLFLTLFDGANVSECYRRTSSVVPQQALALANSPLTQAASKLVAERITRELGEDAGNGAFVTAAFREILNRPATAEETRESVAFLSKANPQTARQRLVHILFNHNDFVTIR